jgi:hypothetical protein
MNNSTINVKEVKQGINSAFANVQFPGDEYLLNCASKDESEVKIFKGKNWQKWQDIPQKVIDYNYDSLPFLSPLALHFFLPAYMTYGLNNLSSNVLEFTIYKLIPPNNPNDLELRELFFFWVAKLTDEQKAAITLFLKYVKEQYEQLQSLSNDADEALQSYWEHYYVYDKAPCLS